MEKRWGARQSPASDRWIQVRGICLTGGWTKARLEKEAKRCKTRGGVKCEANIGSSCSNHFMS